jgi:hypothetical protein
MRIGVLRGLAVSGTILPLKKTSVIFYIDFVRGTPFQKAKNQINLSNLILNEYF